MAKHRLTGPGPGRPKGCPNKVTRQLREMIERALDKVGGEDYLAQQAKENPTAFLSLLGKILPMQVTGQDGGAIRITVQTGVTADLERGSDPTTKATV